MEHRNFAVVAHRQHQAAHGHQRQKAQRFQSDRLAAGVRAGDHQRVERGAQLYVHRHDLLGVDQRVPRLIEQNSARIVHLRHAGFHFVGKLTLGEYQVKTHGRVVAFDDQVGKAARFCG